VFLRTRNNWFHHTDALRPTLKKYEIKSNKKILLCSSTKLGTPGEGVTKPPIFVISFSLSLSLSLSLSHSLSLSLSLSLSPYSPFFFAHAGICITSQVVKP